MKKRTFYTELAYIIGLFSLALGTAFMERANLGLSMVVAPAYILHLKVSEFLPFFSFGMAEYVLQAVILVFMMILLRRAKLSYLFSFVTTVIYGLMLDLSIALISFLPTYGIASEIIYYILGMVFCPAGVSLLFRTYIPPGAYELFVKEVSVKLNMEIHKFKTIYDYTSCAVAIILSFAFFGLWHFEGIKIGTVVCALLNAPIIHLFTKVFEKHWQFKDRFSFKKYF